LKRIRLLILFIFAAKTITFMQGKKKVKLLVIRFSSIGDIVLCTPVLRCLKQIPNKEIETHFLTKKSFSSIINCNPHVDKVITLDKKLKEIIPLLKKEKYDFIIDLHNNLRSHLVKFQLLRPSRSFHKLNFKKWVLTQFKIDTMPTVHIVDRYMATAEQLGIADDGKGLDYFIPKQEEITPEMLPEGFSSGFVGFVIGGTYFTKRLPMEKIIDICRKITLPIILLGGPEDKETGRIISETPGLTAYNGCGSFSLNGSASLVKQSKAIISHDTGLMHIAAAFNKPIASVWGNTVPELGMYPYFPKDNDNNPSKIFETKGLSCRPCSKIGYNQCPKKHFRCMNDISVDEVVDWAEQVVK
jgi:ADP-heptose:LPS heptosyltransferase